MSVKAGEDHLQHRAVHRQVGHQPLELADLGFQLLEPPNLWHTHAYELLLSKVESRLGHTHLRADLVHCRTVLRLPQGKSDRSFVKRLHGMASTLVLSSGCPKNLRSAWTSLLG